MSQQTDFIFEDIEIAPYFDIETLMSISQETRIGGELMDKLLKRWEQWHPKLHARQFVVGKQQYAIVWLDEDVENEIDNAWEITPSEGFYVNALAQSMCMSAMNEILPEIEDVGCAPAPRPTDELEEALKKVGVPYNATCTSLSRKYAVLTYLPFKGGCEICYLRPDCPKGSGSNDSQASYFIPGFEQ